MATLTNTKVKDTYQSLLKLTSGTITGNLITVEDGNGNTSGLSISNDGIGVDSLHFNLSPSTGVSTFEGLFVENGDAVVRTLGTSAFVDQLVLTASNGIKIGGTYPNLNVEGFDSFASVRGNVGSIDASVYNQSVNIVGGTGISTTADDTSKTLTIVNNAPDQVVSISGGSDLNVTGTYPSFVINHSINSFSIVTDGTPTQPISAGAANSSLTIAGGTGITTSADFTNQTLTITNDAPDQVVSITGANGIAVTGTYPNFTVDGSSVSATGVHEEMFVGVPESPYTLAPNAPQPVAFSVADNAVENTSYHFGTAPAKLQRGAGGEVVENISGQRLTVYVDMSAFVDIQSPNSDITYHLERFDTVQWNKIKSVTRYKGFTGIQVDSFWGIFNLDINEALRVTVESASGNVVLTELSQIKFEVKEIGNII